MKILTKEEFLDKEEFYHKEIEKGKIFVYPTDTIYGLGCDAIQPKAIKRIREIKQRDEKPFSIIVPDKKWIFEHCVIKKDHEKYLEKLPGKFTLIIKLKNKANIAKKELIGDFETIGVRIPDNWFAEFLTRQKLVFVTTSVNLSGQKPIKNISELNAEIADKVDYAIDCGELNGKPSTLIDLTKEEVEIIKR